MYCTQHGNNEVLIHTHFVFHMVVMQSAIVCLSHVVEIPLNLVTSCETTFSSDSSDLKQT